jgi:hypothetical protein
VPWAQAGVPAIIGAIAGFLLIVYNAARGLLTFFVTKLRDDEQVSHHTPRRRSPRLSVVIEPLKPGNLARLKAWVWSCCEALRRLHDALRGSYAWLIPPQRIVSRLQWLAYGMTAVHVYDILFNTVVLPT